MSVAGSPLRVLKRSSGEVCVLVVEGVLDASTYLLLRNTIVKAALNEPRAVIVEVTALSVPVSSAWSVFTSARWHVSVWPDVPVVVVCAAAVGRDTARRAGVTRYVPVRATVEQAVADLPAAVRSSRRRARVELSGVEPVPVARGLIREWLTGWGCTDFVAAATSVATVLVENAAFHAGGTAVLRVESCDRRVTVAVEDSSSALPARIEGDHGCRGVRGLDYLNVVCRSWGYNPTTTGKAVWAVIGPENCL